MTGDNDRDFFRAEVERLMDLLYGTALRLTRNPAAAGDLVWEEVTKAWANLGHLADGQAFQKWLFRILTNPFVSDRRRARSETSETIIGADGEETFSLFEKLHQPFLLWWSNPEQELINTLLREDLERGLDQLAEEYRTVVGLVEANGQSYAEGAGIRGTPIGTARTRLGRARSTLQ